MAKSISTHIEFIDQEHHQAVVAVKTSMTWYKVAFKSKELEDITIVAPGLEIQGDDVDVCLNDLDTEMMSFELISIILVTVFEDK